MGHQILAGLCRSLNRLHDPDRCLCNGLRAPADVLHRIRDIGRDPVRLEERGPECTDRLLRIILDDEEGVRLPDQNMGGEISRRNRLKSDGEILCAHIKSIRMIP